MKSLTLQRWLYEALRTKDAEAVRECLERGADVNITGNGQAPLHIAGQYGDTDTARLLLDAGADVNTKDQYGMTPLPYAARSGNPGEVRLLIEAGADVNARSTTNDTPLHYAAYNGHTETIRVLLSAGADVNVVNRNGATPLSFAAQQRNPDAVCALLDAGADVNAKDREGRTAAFYAQSPEMIRFLAKYEADFFVKDCEGRLPIFSPLISGFIFSSPDYPTALAMLKEMVKQGWDYNSPVGREGDIFRYYQDKEEACKAKEELETLQRTIEADQAAFENDYDGYER